MPTIPGFPKNMPSFAKNIHMHSNPSFLQGRAYVQFGFGGTPEQLKPYIDEALSNSKVVVLKADISNVYVKRYWISIFILKLLNIIKMVICLRP